MYIFCFINLNHITKDILENINFNLYYQVTKICDLCVHKILNQIFFLEKNTQALSEETNNEV